MGIEAVQSREHEEPRASVVGRYDVLRLRIKTRVYLCGYFVMFVAGCAADSWATALWNSVRHLLRF